MSVVLDALVLIGIFLGTVVCFWALMAIVVIALTPKG